MVPMSKRAGDGSGYWSTQIGASIFFVVLGFTGGIVILSSDSEEKGGGVMLLLVGILFLGTLFWLIHQMRKHTPEQRAIYAWAIMQQQRRRRNDFQTMGIASQARDGKLSRDEILALQALRPEIPYPGELPPPVDPPNGAGLS